MTVEKLANGLFNAGIVVMTLAVINVGTLPATAPGVAKPVPLTSERAPLAMAVMFVARRKS